MIYFMMIHDLNMIDIYIYIYIYIKIKISDIAYQKMFQKNHVCMENIYITFSEVYNLSISCMLNVKKYITIFYIY